MPSNCPNDFSLSRDLPRPHDEVSCDSMDKEHIAVSYHHAKFGCHRHSGSEDLMFLVCHAISSGHEIKGSCDFMGGNSLW